MNRDSKKWLRPAWLCAAVFCAVLPVAEPAWSASITGRVVNLAAQPIAGATVSAYDSSARSQAAATTGADGEYAINGLTAGVYRVFLLLPTYGYGIWHEGQPDYEHADPVALEADESRPLAFVVANGGRVSGRATTADGAALPRAIVNLYTTNFQFVAGTEADAIGQYAISGIPPGFYTALFVDPSGRHAFRWLGDTPDLRAASACEVPSDGEATGVDARLPLRVLPPYQITQADPHPTEKSLRLEWLSATGSVYFIEGTDVLAPSPDFRPVSPYLHATGTATSIDLPIGDADRMFYRVRQW